MWMVLGLAYLSACDGGLRVPNIEVDPCTGNPVTLRVEVVDAQGGPVGGAVVTATNTETGHSITSTTTERGVTTAVHEDIGPGRVVLTALAGTRPSDSAEVKWTCDECHCYPEPGSVQLHLRP
ncbi:putative lipoprotein [Cystobacter fuscus]|uniref:Putative lipoprotein n=1 Tax=Cystobacter fuscus TaxID=43 RepID=A0A250J0D3_9BACT|nr:carboxypeptidase-like regulatory domain-containing protein [Cystobacter fuscus]ATB37439.1 putative lipoprotein [Cystobacter fuscus]